MKSTIPQLRTAKTRVLAILALSIAISHAEVAAPSVFGDHMVLQRGRPVPIFGTAAPGERVTVAFASQKVTVTADLRGRWQALLAPLAADTSGRDLSISGAKRLTFTDVVVGDVWLCSGQSNMAFGLGGCRHGDDVETADFPGIRQLGVPLTPSGTPLATLSGSPRWVACRPDSAAGFSAVAFYFARRIFIDQHGQVPIGLIVSSVGGTRIDPWLAPDGLTDIPLLHPLLEQEPLPAGPFSLFNGMIHPLAPYALKGAIWYQGENSEATTQSPDSYYLKMKALVQGWKRVWGMDDFPFYFVVLANWGAAPKDATPQLKLGGWDADTRLQQVKALSLPHCGSGSAMDIGDSENMHPIDKLDVGERLALAALKRDYGRAELEDCGPVLRDAVLSGTRVVCSFDHLGGGLMVGAKLPFQPTVEDRGAKLRLFSIAGADGSWQQAEAVISGDTVVMSSPLVAAPRKVAYACWQNPLRCNLYNRAGLPAAPFYVEDVTLKHAITASAGPGGRISPSGATTRLPGSTALYTITADPGQRIREVTVDGRPVGSAAQYTFDPIHADHAISATFAATAPSYAITASAGKGGTMTPTGTVRLDQGGAATFDISAAAGNVCAVQVDGVALGARDRFTFSDARTDHTIAATFSCVITSMAGFGGAIQPDGRVVVAYGADQPFTITALPGHAIADVLVDGVSVGRSGTQVFHGVTAGHEVRARFTAAAGGDADPRAIPRRESLIAAARAADLPAGGPLAAWPSFWPMGQHFAAIGAPGIQVIDGARFMDVAYEKGNGVTLGTFTAPIACSGASIVAVVRPKRNAAASAWTSLVDVFYDRLVLGVRGDTGKVCVRCLGQIHDSATAIPEGQITVLALIAQADGAYRVFANGNELMAQGGTGPLTSLRPGEPAYAHSITVGRNAPDGWTTSNGQIGDVLVYAAALSEAERRQLEGHLMAVLDQAAAAGSRR